MSRDLGRRDLLKLGLGGMAGLALPAGALQSQEPAEDERPPGTSGTPRNLRANYVIQPGVISRIEQAEVTVSAPWAIPAAFADHSRSLQAPVKPKLDDLMKWADATASQQGEIPFHGDLSLDDAIRVPILGGLPMTNLIGDGLRAVVDGKQLSLELTFTTGPTDLTRRRIDTSAGLPVVLPADPSTPEADPGEGALAEKATVSVPLGKWRLTINGPDFHSLGTCVRQNVRHFNLHVQREIPNRRGRFRDVKNFHLGSYRSGSQRCFVLWNSVSPGVVCWKKCSPRSSDLKQMLAWTILVAAAIVGVAVSASAASTMAAAAAAVFFPILIVL